MERVRAGRCRGRNDGVCAQSVGRGIVQRGRGRIHIYGDVLWVAMMQEIVPREVLGRVSSLVYLLAFSLHPSAFSSVVSRLTRSASASRCC